MMATATRRAAITARGIKGVAGLNVRVSTGPQAEKHRPATHPAAPRAATTEQGYTVDEGHVYHGVHTAAEVRARCRQLAGPIQHATFERKRGLPELLDVKVRLNARQHEPVRVRETDQGTWRRRAPGSQVPEVISCWELGGCGWCRVRTRLSSPATVSAGTQDLREGAAA